MTGRVLLQPVALAAGEVQQRQGGMAATTVNVQWQGATAAGPVHRLVVTDAGVQAAG